MPAAYAYEDTPVPIGRCQTCSEPSMVAFMLDLLEPGPGMRMLEIGSGSGYAAAIASLLCAPGGIVHACEYHGELARSMRSHLDRWGAGRDDAGDVRGVVETIAGDGSAGFPDLAPFDRILVSAGVRRSPPGGRESGSGGGFSEEILLGQLGEGGILVYPEASGALYRIRVEGGGRVRESWWGVAFVPLVGANA